MISAECGHQTLVTKIAGAGYLAFYRWNQQHLKTKYRLNPVQSSILILYTCVMLTVCRAPPSACVLMFWLSRDVSGWGVGVFPPANDSAQVRLRVDETKRLDAVQTTENG